MQIDNLHIKLLVDEVSESLRVALGQQCLAIYLMGSLARGGFSPLASDIDIGVVVDTKMDSTGDIIQRIRAQVAQGHPEIRNNLSIFWGSIRSINGVIDGGRYPPFDRLDLINHGQLVYGLDVRNQLIPPSRKELENDSALFALDYLARDARVSEFGHLKNMAQQGVVHVTKTILFPARFIYLAQTGNIAGNDSSKEYYLKYFSGPDATLVKQGYEWRLKGLPDDLALVCRYLEEGLVILYVNFIDIYVQKMEHYAEFEIAGDLRSWKNRILEKY